MLFACSFKGKGWLRILGVRKKEPAASDSNTTAVETWRTNNARVLSWLIGSVDPSIALTFRSFSTAADVWAHLKLVYSQVSTNRLFDLEYELANLVQGDKTINQYYMAASRLWTELDLLTTSTLTGAVGVAVLKDRRKMRILQFLMKLRPDFEAVRAQLLAGKELEINHVLGELSRVETWLHTQSRLDSVNPSLDAAFAVSSIPSGNLGQQGADTTLSQGNSQKGQVNWAEVKCRHCGMMGHSLGYCKQRNFCNYCKKPGHIIPECSLRSSRSRTRGSSYSVTPHSDSAVTSAGGVSESALDRMVQAALGRALPSAINAAFATVGFSGTASWLFDSAAFNHMTGDRSLFTQYKPVSSSMVEVANGACLPIQGIGTVVTPTLTLPQTLHIPALVPNLVSVGQLTDAGCVVSFGPNGCVVQEQQSQRQLGTGAKEGRIFKVDHLQIPTSCRDHKDGGAAAEVFHKEICHQDLSNCCFSVRLSDSQLWDLWHFRLGHPNSVRLRYMFQKQLLPASLQDMNFTTPDCVPCVEAKLIALPFKSSSTVIPAAFDLVHTDLWGPAPVTSRMGYRYFALFIDHHTRFAWVYFLRAKSELNEIAQRFVQMVRTQFGKTVKTIRSDPGGEFQSTLLHEFYRQNGILFQQSCPGVSEQNGLVERKHRHVLDLTRALLLQTAVPASFWVETVRTVVYLINRQPTPILKNVTPYEILHGRRPDYSRLRVFGCVCFVLLPKKDRSKLSTKVARCVFVGNSDHHKGYLCYDPVTHRLHIAYHVAFLEHVFYYRCNAPSIQSLPSLPNFESSDAALDVETMEVDPHVEDNEVIHNGTLEVAAPDPPPRRSSRLTHGVPPARFNDYVTYTVSPVKIPTSYKQACGDPNWTKAMDVEKLALAENNTWDIVPRPPDALVIGSRWLYTAKFKPDGSLERYKARFIAQGFRQEYGIDYDETFAPVAKMQTVRILMALAAQRNWPLLQLDVKNAFLHGDLKETVYVECPPGFDKGSQDVVCLLKKSLYGLKQAPRAWFETFQNIILTSDFQQSRNDPSLFTKQSSRGITILLIYVDDMILTGDDSQGIAEVKGLLRSHFKLKELGDLSYFLGLEVSRSSQGILLSQKKYVNDLLDLARLSDCKPCATPMEVNLKLSKDDDGPLENPTLYRRLVGSLIYLTSTRPDLAYAVQIVSQFMGSPRQSHQTAVVRILRYLQGTRDHRMFFSSSASTQLSAFADADHAGCIDTRRSTSGWCIQYGQAFVSWRCKKQDRVSKSSTEAEYRSMSDVCSEVVWVQRLLTELGAAVSLPVRLYGDNTSAIRIATNPVLHDRTKHIETHIHYIRDLVHDGIVQLFYITSEDQLADLLTKPLSTSRHWYLIGKLMLISYHQFEGGC
ncbi:Retrovirus-related Pol polyprotein from transposon TNT 1-94 [Linum grandiflorum]